MEMDTSSWNAGTSKDLRIAFKVVCDVNSEYRRIQVKSVEIAVLILLTLIIHFPLFAIPPQN
jgi:hypothetical protein